MALSEASFRSMEPLSGKEPLIATPLQLVCAHCGLPVPKGLIEANSTEQFCCGGCKMAFRIIHSNGLDHYYQMADRREKATLTNRDLSSSSTRFDDFDQPAFLETFGQKINDDIHQITLQLGGIHCAACIWLIEKLPRIVPGVIEVKLNWARKTAQVCWQPTIVRLSQIAQSLYQLGYTPHPIRENEREALRRNENRQHLVRIGVAAAAAGNNMLFATSLYLGMFAHMAVDMGQLLRVASCVVGLVSLFWPGRVFLNGAMNAIRTRTPHMDLPIALGLTVGGLAGVVNTIRGVGEIYFDSLSVLVFLLLVGRWIQFRQQNLAADSVEMLYRLTPKKARKLVNGQPVETFVDLVQVGDLLSVFAGDLLPVDAKIVQGTTDIDESILTGESKLQRKQVGDFVLAGTLNQSSPITIESIATGRETRLSKIVELVEQATLDKPQIVEWANRIGSYFVVTVIGLATLTFGIWLWIDASVAVDRTVSLLVVACPCALALATPLAISVALGRAAKRKIMIKGGDVLQLLDRPGMIWLDKTGTLTEGKLEVREWHGDSKWKPLVATLESKSSHPIARAITDYVGPSNRAADLERNFSVVDHLGQGIACELSEMKVLIGNEKLLNENGVEIDRKSRILADQILAENLAPCWIAANQEIVGIVAIGDKLRANTLSAIDQLRSAGWKVGILSGDHQRIVNQVAERLGIQHSMALGAQTPEQKVEMVKQSFGEFETVVMVGDGVNDSAALAAASVGIAVHNGAEASLASAPVYLAEEGLQPIINLLEISKSANRTIRVNFAASLSYNFFGALLAAMGWINPLFAAILMPISSLTVVAISLSSGSTQGQNQKVDR